MSESDPSAPHDDDITVAACAWIARRDRGLTATEQDAFLQWLRDDERHRLELSKQDRTWSALDSLTQWQPEHSSIPNPRLLASPHLQPRRRSRRGLIGAAMGIAVAALVTILFFSTYGPSDAFVSSAGAQLRVIPRPESHTLSDGSTLEMNHGSRFEIAFTESERRVRLLNGEVHVVVTKNPARPFIVEADGLEVRAVGTAFAVRRGTGAVEVVVTEGSVELETAPPEARSKATSTPIASGERARIDTTSSNVAPVVVPISAEEIARELAWQSVRLEFEASPLVAVIEEFNLRNRQQLVIGDPAVGQIRVAGTFRADHVEVFVLLLEASFGVHVERPAAGPWVLRKAQPVRKMEEMRRD